MATTQDERTRLQLHSNEMTMSLVSLRQELEEFRTVATAAQAGRQQLARMVEERLVQTQTTETLNRQVEASNNVAREAQQQHLRMPPTGVSNSVN